MSRKRRESSAARRARADRDRARARRKLCVCEQCGHVQPVRKSEGDVPIPCERCGQMYGRYA